MTGGRGQQPGLGAGHSWRRRKHWVFRGKKVRGVGGSAPRLEAAPPWPLWSSPSVGSWLAGRGAAGGWSAEAEQRHFSGHDTRGGATWGAGGGCSPPHSREGVGGWGVGEAQRPYSPTLEHLKILTLCVFSMTYSKWGGGGGGQADMGCTLGCQSEKAVRTQR